MKKLKIFGSIFILVVSSDQALKANAATNAGTLNTITVTAIPELDCEFRDRYECERMFGSHWQDYYYGGGYSPAYQLPVNNVTASNKDSEEDSCNQTIGNPITIADGRKTHRDQLFNTKWNDGSLEFSIYYDSFAKGHANFASDGKWRHSFDYRLVRNSTGQAIRQ